MIKTTPHKIVILMGILLSPSVFATDINVEFTATVKATTCNITLTGNNVTNDGNNNYTLRIPKMGLDKIANKTTESQADFKLVASGCSSGISWIDTTLTGNASSSSPKLIILNRPGFPGECFICELRLPDHRFRWKHNKLFLLLPEEYGPAFPAIVDCYTSPPT